MRPWVPEHPVDADLARRLVAAAWPDVTGEPVHVGTGWDIDVWRFGELAVRFPRRAFGITCLEQELVVLPRVVERVPLAVPRPVRVAGPLLDHPSRFYAHPWLPGAPLGRAGLDDAALARLAAPLGRFLAALHALPCAGLRDDPRGGIERGLARGREWLAAAPLDDATRARAAEVLASAPPVDVPPVLAHGDFHAGNLLVDDAGALTAVLDWGDACAGDPALDLAIGWSLVPPPARADFLAAYGPVSPATWARARVRAVYVHGLALAAWARDTGDAATLAFATASLTRALATVQ